MTPSRARSRFLPLALGAVAVFCSATPAVSATRTVTHGPQEFLAGELDGLALDVLGQLTPAPVRRESLPTTSLYAWSLALDGRGRLVVGSGDEGRIYRESGDGLEEWVDTLAYEILSLMPFEGDLLAGSSPDGVIYRVDDDGEVTVALDLPQQSVWSLVPGSREGSWLAGSGPGAQIVRGGRGSEAGEVLHRLPATNLTEMVRDEEGLWIGTSGPGLVLRIEGDDDDTPRLVYEAEHGEVATLLADGEGGVYVLGVNAAEGEGKGSRIVRVRADGTVDPVWEGEEILLSLVGSADGGFLAGEAQTGRVLRIDPEGRVGLWVELDGGDPIAMLVNEETTWVATGNLGVVYALRPGEREGGLWTSPVVETPRAARWGRLWVEGWGEGAEVSARSGVRARPDATWSEWTEFGASGSVLDLPPAPYLQYRLRLRNSTVTAAHVAWAEHNVAPRVRYVRVEPAGGELQRTGGGAPAPLRQRFDSGLEVEYSIASSGDRPEPENSAWVRGLRTLHWEGQDANDDELRYEIEVRHLPDGEWFTVATDHAERVLAWDTTAVSDGAYRVRVTASDAAAHPRGEGLTGSLVSAALRVDNTAPVIEDVEVGGERILLRIRDRVSPLREVHWRRDEGEWIPLAPVDGVVDAPVEELSLPLDSDDLRVIWVRAVDRAGNVALHEQRLED